MASIAEFTLPPDGFPPGRIFETRPELRFQLDRVIPAADTFMPYFWIHGTDLAGTLPTFRALPELRSIDLLEDLGDEGLFRAEWNPEFGGVVTAIAESGVTVVSATGSNEGWFFQLRAEDSERLSAFQRSCEENGVDVTLTRLSRVAEVSPGVDADLTPRQPEALLLAYETGYYDDPRGTDLETLATEFDISRQALSSRLRRGHRNLVQALLVDRNPPSP